MELLDKIDWEAILTQVVGFLPRLLVAAAVLVAFWVGFRVARQPLRAVLHRARLEQALVDLLVERIFRCGLLVFGVIMALGQLGVNVSAALAGLGVAGIAVGFAAQDSLANIIAGFLIFIDKPFQVGDWVTVSDQYGQVREITMRTTRIRTNQNTFVVIPNKHIIDQVLVNHSKHGETRIDVPVGIAYKEDVTRAREVLLAAAGELEHVLSDPEPTVAVTGLGSSSVDLELRVWIADAGQEQPVLAAATEAAKRALDAADIEIPFPHLQLFVEQVEERVWERVASLPQRSGPGSLRAGSSGSGPPGPASTEPGAGAGLP